jgi:hypothetical protein
MTWHLRRVDPEQSDPFRAASDRIAIGDPAGAHLTTGRLGRRVSEKRQQKK